MEFEGKYKNWYERLLKINYGEEFAKMKIEKFAELENEDYWNKKKEEFIKKGIEPNEVNDRIEKLRKNIGDLEIRIKALEWSREMELKVLERAIPKKDLEDGAWYETDDEGGKLARFGRKAKWIEKDNKFLAPGQQQFGMDGYLDHWEDAIDNGYAGFAPMKKVEE